jgi:hypothetical protein
MFESSAGTEIDYRRFVGVLIQESEEHHDGLLSLGQNTFEIHLCRDEIRLGFDACLAQGIELGLDFVRGCGRIIQGRAQILLCGLHGTWRSTTATTKSTTTAPSTTTGATAARTTTAATTTTEHAAHAATIGAGVALGLLDFLNLGL